MKNTSARQVTLRSALPAYKGGRIIDTIRRALTAAGIPTRTAPMTLVDDTIQRALSSAGLMTDASESRQPSIGTTPLVGPLIGLPGKVGKVVSSRVVAREEPGHFVSSSYSNAAGTRTYKLYVPECSTVKPMPLIVMLHGCTQDPDDFAAGTGMNWLAEKEGFLVLYPAQSANANGAKCWNWFDPTHQVTDRGEPSLIAGMTREVSSIYPVDDKRIFVAGLSAGAAMAVILGATYPELYAAVGAHSGLPCGAADDLLSAFAAMRGGAGSRSGHGSRGQTSRSQAARMRATPTIVFHGDEDTTVNTLNGTAIVSQAVALGTEFRGALSKVVQERHFTNGREYTATIYRDSGRRPHIEEWILHGAGHAWSGGSAEGSYTDVTGPDASAEMLRFFLAQVPSIADRSFDKKD
jgi:poly(hydroxyalkanoate) depolymerase family esterase